MEQPRNRAEKYLPRYVGSGKVISVVWWTKAYIRPSIQSSVSSTCLRWLAYARPKAAGIALATSKKIICITGSSRGEVMLVRPKI